MRRYLILALTVLALVAGPLAPAMAEEDATKEAVASAPAAEPEKTAKAEPEKAAEPEKTTEAEPEKAAEPAPEKSSPETTEPDATAGPEEKQDVADGESSGDGAEPGADPEEQADSPVAGVAEVRQASALVEAAEPSWPALRLEGPSGALVWVESEVAAGSGGQLRLRGSGWQTTAGTASTIAVKVNSGPTSQYSRSGSGLVQHPSAPEDTTIWVLLSATNPAGHANVLPVSGEGAFEVSIDAPPGLVAGQYLSLTFQTGRFDETDVQRTMTSSLIEVGGVAFVDDSDDGGDTEACIPSTATPTVRVAEQATIGGTVAVTGTGWCHPTSGGSVIAIKLDEGAYSHLSGEIHQNRTIWALFEADPLTGDFSIDLQLPDGTTATSSPAFTEGGHTLRLLTGSMKSGDTIRSMVSGPFVVGRYQPTTEPDPVAPAEDLSLTNAGGLVVDQNSSRLLVTIPGLTEGAWVYLNLYDGEVPVYPWTGWFRASATGTVTASLKGVQLPTGSPVLTAQSGERDGFGDLLGWAEITGSTLTPTVTTSTLPTVPTLAATLSLLTATPAAPASRASQLPEAGQDKVSAKGDPDSLVVTVGKGHASGWIFLYVYTGARVSPAGWIQLDVNRQFRLDLSEFGVGRHRLVVVDGEGTLLGWTEVASGVVEQDEPDGDDPAEAATVGSDPGTSTPTAQPATEVAAAAASGQADAPVFALAAIIALAGIGSGLTLARVGGRKAS